MNNRLGKNLHILAAAATVAGDTHLTMMGAVNIQAAMLPEDGRAEGPRVPTFEMLAYTGGAMMLGAPSKPPKDIDYQYPFVVDLDGMERIDRPRPILRDHNTGSIVGHTAQISVIDHQLRASGFLSGSSIYTWEILDSAGKGFPWQCSIGARILSNEFVPAGKTAEANGRTWEGPVNIARKTSLGEISFVGLGADDQTSARIAAMAAKGTSIMKTFTAWCEEHKLDRDKLEGARLKAARALYKASGDYDADDPDGQDEDATATGQDKEPDGKDATAAARAGDIAASGAAGHSTAGNAGTAAGGGSAVADVRAEMSRIHAINATAAKHPEIAAKAISGGWSIEATRQQVELTELRAGRSFGIISSSPEQDMSAANLAAAAALRVGVRESIALAGLDERAKNAIMGRRLRSVGVHTILAHVAASHGIAAGAGSIDDDCLRNILSAEQRMHLMAGTGGVSTMSLSSVLENIQNKALLEMYESFPSVVSEIAYETDTNDFKQFKAYSITGSGRMQPLGPGGQLNQFSLQDAGYPNQIDTKGLIMVIDRKMLIDDDLNAIARAPQAITFEALQSREEAVVDHLIARAATLFTEAKGNALAAGAASALSIDSLTTGVKLFAEQQDDNGRPVMILPDRLFVPPALKGPADTIHQGTGLVVTGLGATNAKSTQVNLNQHANRYKPIMSPYFGAGQGGSDTHWLLLADPKRRAVIQVAYLRGRRMPTVERGEVNFNQLGIAMRIFWDWGVADMDDKAGVYSPGA